MEIKREHSLNKPNPYGILSDFHSALYVLNITKGDPEWDTHRDWVDTCHLIRWFGADKINPVVESRYTSGGVLQRLVYYNDDGTIRSSELL